MVLKGASPPGKEIPPQKAGEDNTESGILQEGQSCYMYFQGGWRNWERFLCVDGCFVSVNHFSEESLDRVNDSMKTKSLPWLSSLQMSNHTGELSTGCVLASERWQESTWMLLKPSKFTSVGHSIGELSQGWYLNCLGMLQFPAFWLK